MHFASTNPKNDRRSMDRTILMDCSTDRTLQYSYRTAHTYSTGILKSTNKSWPNIWSIDEYDIFLHILEKKSIALPPSSLQDTKKMIILYFFSRMNIKITWRNVTVVNQERFYSMTKYIGCDTNPFIIIAFAILAPYVPVPLLIVACNQRWHASLG